MANATKTHAETDLSPKGLPVPEDATAPAKPAKADDGLIKLSYKVERAMKLRFDALATLCGETPDARITRLILADIAANMPPVPGAAGATQVP